MTFERPEAWWLLALAAPIVLLHLHLRRRRDVEVSSLELWRGLVPARAGRGAFRNLRDRVALAFLVVALVAFAASAAGPVTGAPASPGRRLSIVVDGSASMNARLLGGTTRFAEAAGAAQKAAATLGPQDEVVVWLAGESPRVVVEPTRTKDGIDAALLAAGPSLAPSSLAATATDALAAARGVSDREATVFVLTDEVDAATVPGLEARGVQFHLGVVDGAPARNAGISAIEVGPTAITVHVAVTDENPASRDVVLRTRSGEFGRSKVLFHPGGGEAGLALVEGAKADGLLEIRLDPPDDFPDDDVAGLALPVVRPLAVALVSAAPSPFLVEALRAMPDVVDPAKTVLVAPDAPPSAFDGADVVVADGAAPPAGRPALAFVAQGARVADRPLLWSVGRHPVLAGADLAPLRIERAVVLPLGDGDVQIVASSAGPVGVAGDVLGLRRVTFGFPPAASTLPLEAAFPVLVRNALRWLAAPRAPPPFVVAGEPLPDADGAVVPLPTPGGPRSLVLAAGGVTAVRWRPPAGFRLSSADPPPYPSAAQVVAALPDRRSDADRRVRHARWLAALGAGLLGAGALLLRRPVLHRINRAAATPQLAAASR